jgi:exosome complex RNA-binding protein Csl4
MTRRCVRCNGSLVTVDSDLYCTRCHEDVERGCDMTEAEFDRIERRRKERKP